MGNHCTIDVHHSADARPARERRSEHGGCEPWRSQSLLSLGPVGLAEAGEEYPVATRTIRKTLQMSDIFQGSETLRTVDERVLLLCTG